MTCPECTLPIPAQPYAANCTQPTLPIYIPAHRPLVPSGGSCGKQHVRQNSARLSAQVLSVTTSVTNHICKHICPGAFCPRSATEPSRPATPS